MAKKKKKRKLRPAGVWPFSIYNPSAEAEWSPASLDAGNLRAWYSMQAASTLFQDSALTTAAGDTDPLGGWTDASGSMEALIQATAGNRPTIGSSGGLLYASFDGAGDVIQGSTASAWKALHGSAGGGIYMVAEWNTAPGSLTSIAGTSVGSNNAGMRLRADTVTLDRLYVQFGNGAANQTTVSATGSWPADTIRVLAGENDGPNADVIARAWNDAGVGTAAYGFTPSSGDPAAAMFVGSNVGTVLKVYELVARSPILTSEELTQLLDYWNGIYGIDP